MLAAIPATCHLRRKVQHRNKMIVARSPLTITERYISLTPICPMLYDPNSRGAYSAINKGCQGNTHNRFHLIKEKGNFIETDYIESSELSQVEFMQAVAKV